MNQVTQLYPHAPDPFIDVEAEQLLLGALLLEPSRLDLLPGMTGETFGDPLHGAIFDRMKLNWKADRPAGPAGLRGWARQQPGFEAVGGIEYLARLAASAIAPSAFKEYADIVRPLAEKRALRDAMLAAMDDLNDPDEAPGDVAGRLEAALMVRAATGTIKPVSMTAAVTEALAKVRAAQEGQPTGRVPTGIHALDRLIGGFNPGELVILAGRPSMGKSAVALSIASRVAGRGQGVCFSSLEMMPVGLAERLISERTPDHGDATNYTTFQTGDLPASKLHAIAKAAKDVSELPIKILPMTYRDVAGILSGSKHARTLLGETVGLRLLIVDYLQIMASAKASRYEQITEISSALKALAGQLEIPVLALSQLSRQVESRDDKRPQLSDLRESGQIEQDADAVIFCFRPEYYCQRCEPDPSKGEEHAKWREAMAQARNRLELIVAKQRQGPIGTAHVMMNPALNRIWEA